MIRCMQLLLVLVVLLPATSSAQSIDLSDVTDKFVKNMELLETLTPEAIVREQMAVVREQAADLGRFFRKNGTASKRRQLFEEQEEIKSKPDLRESDMEKLQELRKEIQELDPDNYFKRGRDLFNEAVKELREELDLIQTSDPVRQDIVRLIRQHLTVYNKALQEY